MVRGCTACLFCFRFYFCFFKIRTIWQGTLRLFVRLGYALEGGTWCFQLGLFFFEHKPQFDCCWSHPDTMWFTGYRFLFLSMLFYTRHSCFSFSSFHLNPPCVPVAPVSQCFGTPATVTLSSECVVEKMTYTYDPENRGRVGGLGPQGPIISFMCMHQWASWRSGHLSRVPLSHHSPRTKSVSLTFILPQTQKGLPHQELRTHREKSCREPGLTC